jgi:16S rRNA (guanine966-N2)-methyltransferase
VDNSQESIDLIKKNSSRFTDSNYKIVKDDYFNALTTMYKSSMQFDIIILDPPYSSDYAERSIEYIRKKKLIKPDGIIIWEHDESKINYVKKTFLNYRTRKHGIKYITFIES